MRRPGSASITPDQSATPSKRKDAEAGDFPATGVRFAIVTARGPQVLCRMLNYFARAAHETEQVRACIHGDEMRIAIHLAALDARTAQIVVEKMRAEVDVIDVSVDFA